MRWTGIIAIGFAGTLLSLAADWPQWLGPNRNGVSTERVEPWKGDLKILWRQPVGEGHSGPVVANGRAFIHYKVAGKEQEELAAFDAKTGKEVWRKAYDRPPFSNIYGNGPRSTPLVDADRVYTVGPTGLLHCWDAATGAEKWKLDLLKEFKASNLFFGVSTSPIVDGDRLLVMVGGPEASIVALDKQSGKLLWKSGSDRASYASPIITEQGQQRLGLFLTQQGVVAIDPTDGKQHWRFPLVDLLNESSTTPVRIGDVTFASSVTYGSVGLKMTMKDGKPAYERLWKNGLNSYFATPVAHDDHLYAVFVTGLRNPTAQLHCLDPQTGKSLWMKPNVGKYHATVLLAKDRLLLLEEGGDLVLIDPNPKEYKELARAKVCGQTWAHPALSDGRLLVRDGKELVCVELSEQ
jgi:outer membrane protein assembly factor BamB